MSSFALFLAKDRLRDVALRPCFIECHFSLSLRGPIFDIRLLAGVCCARTRAKSEVPGNWDKFSHAVAVHRKAEIQAPLT